MTRVKKEVVFNNFKWFCDVLGKRIATSYNDVGAWRLDSTDRYTRFSIEEIASERGGVTHPFTGRVYSGSELLDLMHFAMRAIALDRNQDKHIYWPKDKNTKGV